MKLYLKNSTLIIKNAEKQVVTFDTTQLISGSFWNWNNSAHTPTTVSGWQCSGQSFSVKPGDTIYLKNPNNPTFNPLFAYTYYKKNENNEYVCVSGEYVENGSIVPAGAEIVNISAIPSVAGELWIQVFKLYGTYGVKEV